MAGDEVQCHGLVRRPIIAIRTGHDAAAFVVVQHFFPGDIRHVRTATHVCVALPYLHRIMATVVCSVVGVKTVWIDEVSRVTELVHQWTLEIERVTITGGGNVAVHAAAEDTAGESPL